MKTLLIGLMTLVFAGAAPALDKAELDGRVQALISKFDLLQAQPDRRIPAEVLRQAQGIVLLDRTKAGLLFAYQGGGGVAMVRDAKTHEWGPVAFVTASEASLGFQIGGERNFYVLVIMDRNAMKLLTESNFEVKSEVRATAGEDSAGREGRISKPKPPFLIYDDRKGLFAGADVKAGAISPEVDANRVYYGQLLSMNDILFEKKVAATAAAQNLAAKLTEQARMTEK